MKQQNEKPDMSEPIRWGAWCSATIDMWSSLLERAPVRIAARLIQMWWAIALFSIRTVIAPFRIVRYWREIGKIAVVVLGFHFGAQGVLTVEREVPKYALATANAMVDTAASSLGYEKPVPFYETMPLTVEELIEREALRNDYSPRLLYALAWVESRLKANARSRKGAIGVLQVMPEHLKFCGLTSARQLEDVEINVACGARVFRDALEATANRDGWDVAAAIMYYNGGPDGLKHGYPESVKHAQLVLAYLAQDIR